MVNDVVEKTKIQNIPGILVQLDFCKAFDSIEWSFVKRSLALFNFGDSIKQWVSNFYNNSESTVLNNGFCTDFFKLSFVPLFIYRRVGNLSVQNQTRRNNKRNNSFSKRAETRPVCRRHNSFMIAIRSIELSRFLIPLGIYLALS